MLSAILAASAAAQPPSCDAPPGVAGVDQYCEDTPGTPREPRGDRDDGPAVPRDTERRVRDESGGGALLESLRGGGSGDGAGSADGGGSANSSGDGGRGEGGRDAGEGQRSGGGGGPGSDAAEAAPGDAVSGVASAGSSLWFGEMRGVIVLLGLTLVAAVALGARRRASSD